jgi:hypothetical protein
MAIEFYPTPKLIKITSGTSITALEIYNAAMDWVDSQEGMAYTCPIAAYGKFGMGGGVYSDSIFVLLDGWKIKLYNGTYQFTIIGTLITDDQTARTISPDSGNVEVVFQVTSQGINLQSDDIATIKKLNQNRWKILNNQLIIYDDDGVTPIRTFDLKNAAGEPAEQDVYERQPTP